jgi:hypothetical protein
VRNAACRFMRSSNSVGKSWEVEGCVGEGVEATRFELELLKLNADRVGVFVVMQKRSSKLRAPFVGVSIEIGDDPVVIGFWGVCGSRVSCDRRDGRGLISLQIVIVAGPSSEMSPSVCANFLFCPVVEYTEVIAMAST